MRIIKLGNPEPKAYRNNPSPPPDFTLDQYEKFAEQVCGLDISKVPKEGKEIRSRSGDLQYVVTKSHRSAFILDMIQKPVSIKWLGGECVTTVQISPVSTLDEAAKEVRTCWQAAGFGTPSWIAGTHEGLVQMVKNDLAIPEIRDYEENVT